MLKTCVFLLGVDAAILRYNGAENIEPQTTQTGTLKLREQNLVVRCLSIFYESICVLTYTRNGQSLNYENVSILHTILVIVLTKKV